MMQKAEKTIHEMSILMINEITKYRKPPEIIQKGLEAIVYLLKGKKLTWEKIRSEINSGDFIRDILTFNLSNVSMEIIDVVKREYIQTETWDLKRLQKASKAMGPLGNWLQCQVELAELSKSNENAKFIMNSNVEILKLEQKKSFIMQEIESCNIECVLIEEENEVLGNEVSDLRHFLNLMTANNENTVIKKRRSSINGILINPEKIFEKINQIGNNDNLDNEDSSDKLSIIYESNVDDKTDKFIKLDSGTQTEEMENSKNDNGGLKLVDVDIQTDNSLLDLLLESLMTDNNNKLQDQLKQIEELKMKMQAENDAKNKKFLDMKNAEIENLKKLKDNWKNEAEKERENIRKNQLEELAQNKKKFDDDLSKKLHEFESDLANQKKQFNDNCSDKKKQLENEQQNFEKYKQNYLDSFQRNKNEFEKAIEDLNLRNQNNNVDYQNKLKELEKLKSDIENQIAKKTKENCDKMQNQLNTEKELLLKKINSLENKEDALSKKGQILEKQINASFSSE